MSGGGVNDALAAGHEIGAEGPRVARQVPRCCLEAGGIRAVDVEVVIHVIGKTQRVGRVTVSGLAIFYSVRECEERRQKLKVRQRSQRVAGLRRRVGVEVTGHTECALLNGRVGRWVALDESTDLGRIGEADAVLGEQGLQHEVIANLRQVQCRERVCVRRRAECGLFVVCVVHAEGSGHAIRGMPVNRAEERVGLVVLAKRLARALASLTEGRADRQSERTFDLRDRAAGKGVHVTAEIRSELEFVLDRHFFIKVEAADHPVDCAITRRRQAEFLGEGFDIRRVGVAADQVSAREVRVSVL